MTTWFIDVGLGLSIGNMFMLCLHCWLDYMNLKRATAHLNETRRMLAMLPPEVVQSQEHTGEGV